MVIKSLMTLIALASLLAHANDSDDQLTAPQLHRFELPAILQIVVETASENVSEKRREKAAAGDPDCTDFRIDTNNISAYLRQASMISRNDFMHVVEWSPCQASGSIAFADGTHGKWRVQQYGAGMLLHGEETTYLYCHDCGKPFMPD